MAGLLSQEFNEGLFVLNDMELRPIEFKKVHSFNSFQVAGLKGEKGTD